MEQRRLSNIGRGPVGLQVRKGSWIDTGRYRPAQVLGMMPDPPHVMRLSYDDEIDEDFRPHIVEWEKVPKPKPFPSLTDEFSSGDWVRHPRYGYGQIIAVQNTTMTVKFGARESRFIPDRDLALFVKVEAPVQENSRPVAEQFPPGAWIEQHFVGKALVLDVDDETLTVLGSRGVTQIAALTSDGNTSVFKQSRVPMDLSRPIEQRRLWWWRHAVTQNDGWPCACCGYPIIGVPSRDWEGLSHCVVYGWINTWATEQEVYPLNVEERYTPLLNTDRFLEQEWPNAGYRLEMARENFENHGYMYDESDERRGTHENLAETRRHLVQKIDHVLSRDAGINGEDTVDISHNEELVKHRSMS